MTSSTGKNAELYDKWWELHVQQQRLGSSGRSLAMEPAIGVEGGLTNGGAMPPGHVSSGGGGRLTAGKLLQEAQGKRFQAPAAQGGGGG